MEELTEQDIVMIVTTLYDDFNRQDMDACWAPLAS